MLSNSFKMMAVTLTDKRKEKISLIFGLIVLLHEIIFPSIQE